MAKAKVTVIEKRVGTVYASFGFGRGEGEDDWRWRQYQTANVSAASARRFERAMNKQVERVRHSQRLAHAALSRLQQQGEKI